MSSSQPCSSGCIRLEGRRLVALISARAAPACPARRPAATPERSYSAQLFPRAGGVWEGDGTGVRATRLCSAWSVTGDRRSVPSAKSPIDVTAMGKETQGQRSGSGVGGGEPHVGPLGVLPIHTVELRVGADGGARLTGLDRQRDIHTKVAGTYLDVMVGGTERSAETWVLHGTHGQARPQAVGVPGTLGLWARWGPSRKESQVQEIGGDRRGSWADGTGGTEGVVSTGLDLGRTCLPPLTNAHHSFPQCGEMLPL